MEKRSHATKDIQHAVEEALKYNTTRVEMIIQLFTKLTQEQTQVTSRRSGLYGLGAVSVTLYQRGRNLQFLDSIVAPICRCFSDKDTKVQQAACDVIFNVIKIYSEAMLSNQYFDKIFDSTITLISSPQ